MNAFEALLFKLPIIDSGRRSGLILQGPPGVGKTSRLIKMAVNMPCVRIPMGTRNADEFGVFPFPLRREKTINESFVNEKNETIDQTVTSEYVVVEQALSEVSLEPLLEENIGLGHGLLILDDVTLGDPSLQGAILDLVQFGMIANRKIGPNVIITLTGNRPDDGSYAIEWSDALMSRCLFVDVDADFGQWKSQPENENIEPSMISFLSEHPDFFAPPVKCKKTTDKNGKTPSPRDWTRLGMSLIAMGGANAFQPDMLFPALGSYINANVGRVAGEAYSAYHDAFGIYPTAKELFADPETWTSLGEEYKNVFSGGLAVLYGLRNHVYQLVMKAKNTKEVAEIVSVFMDRAELMSQDNREIISFAFSAVLKPSLKGLSDTDVGRIENAGMDVLMSDKFINDPAFASYFSSVYSENQKAS